MGKPQTKTPEVGMAIMARANQTTTDRSNLSYDETASIGARTSEARLYEAALKNFRSFLTANKVYIHTYPLGFPDNWHE